MATTEQLNAALDGRYAIERLVGEGGMATVYLARDVRHNRGSEHLMVARLNDGARLAVAARETLFRDDDRINPNRSNYDVLPDGSGFVFVRFRTGASELGRSRLVVMMNWHLKNRTRDELSQR